MTPVQISKFFNRQRPALRLEVCEIFSEPGTVIAQTLVNNLAECVVRVDDKNAENFGN